MFQKMRGLGEIACTVIQNSATLSPAKAICHSPLHNSSEFSNSKAAQSEEKEMLRLWQLTELECHSAQKKTLLSRKNCRDNRLLPWGSAPFARKCKAKANVHVTTCTRTTANLFAIQSQTFTLGRDSGNQILYYFAMTMLYFHQGQGCI